MSRTLILSATITPPSGVRGLNRADPALRLNDYLQAFEFYLKLPNEILSQVVIADNSNSDVSALRRLADRFGNGKNVHVLSFDGLDHPASYGRGYGELKLLDRIIDDFEPVSKLPPDSIVWKGTGRYRLLNMDAMIRRAPEPYDFYFDQKVWPTPWFDMRFFSFSMAGYRRIMRGRYRDLREDVVGGTQDPGVSVSEIELRKIIDPFIGEKGVIPRFNVEPLVDGLRSFDSTSYVDRKGRVKHLLRKTVRAIAPQIWV